ncbi:MAG: response regulator transcription factor [Cellvibrionaceae bacterium]
MLNIVIADDHPLFRTALVATLTKTLTEVNLLEASDFSTLQKSIDHHSDIDLILLDLHMPGAEGFSVLVYLTAHYPQVPVIVVSAHEEPVVMQRAIDHGASGFLPKSSSSSIISEAIDAVLAGKLWLPAGFSSKKVIVDAEKNAATAFAALTPQQCRVAIMVYQGLLNKQIAHELHVTEATIKAHMTEIFKKFGVHSRTQIVLAVGQLAVSSQQFIDDIILADSEL